MIESPGFCRASPPWTLSVENFGGGVSRRLFGQRFDRRAAWSCAWYSSSIIFKRRAGHPAAGFAGCRVACGLAAGATKNRSAKSRHAACIFPSCADERAIECLKTSARLRDVGSLAVSAASGHKSRVRLIVLCAAGETQVSRKKPAILVVPSPKCGSGSIRRCHTEALRGVRLDSSEYLGMAGYGFQKNCPTTLRPALWQRFAQRRTMKFTQRRSRQSIMDQAPHISDSVSALAPRVARNEISARVGGPLVVVCGITDSSRAIAAEPGKLVAAADQASQGSAATGQEISRWIDELGHDAFTVRQTAASRLLAAGMPPASRCWQSSKDPIRKPGPPPSTGSSDRSDRVSPPAGSIRGRHRRPARTYASRLGAIPKARRSPIRPARALFVDMQRHEGALISATLSGSIRTPSDFWNRGYYGSCNGRTFPAIARMRRVR